MSAQALTEAADTTGRSLYNREVRAVDRANADAPSVICPLCRHVGADARFEIEGLSSRVVVCRNCQVGFIEPALSPEEIASHYPPAYYGQTGRKFTKLVEFGVRLVGSRHVRYLARMVPAGGRILDIGCGRGILLRELANLGYETHGFEVVEAAAAGVDPRVQLRIGNDLSEVNYPDQFFDQVIVWHVFEHVPRPRALLEEIHRILKPGGEVVVAVPNFSSLQARWSGAAWFHLDLPRHLFHFPLRTLIGLLQEAGFAVESQHHFSLRQNPFGWVQSALNKLPGLSRNSLYELLHTRRANIHLPFSLPLRLGLYAAFVLGMPLGLLLELGATLLRRGATIHVVARR